MGLKADFLLAQAGQLCTLSGHDGRPAAGHGQGDPVAVTGGAVAAYGGTIVAAGREDDVRRAVDLVPGAMVLDAEGRLVTPGLIDAHTHLCFAGWRAGEFGLRVAGAAYLDILKAGGGILNTVRATREASEDELVAGLGRRLQEILALGTTSVEIKSGYGLDLDTELKQLRAIRRAADATPQEVVATFLGAHAVPPEFRGREDAFAGLVAEEMVPAVARQGLAEFVDVFCEDGAFTLEQTRVILEAARRVGLGRKVHADEVNHLGGARLAADLGAASADHLAVTPPSDFAALRGAGTVACLLPATSFFLMKERHAPARGLIEAGVAVALATDYNPGTQPGGSLPLVMSMGCLLLRMTPAEALAAVTLNAAHAIGRGERLGSLEPGKRADLVVWDCPTLDHLPYRMGVNLAETVVVAGRVAARGGRPLVAEEGRTAR